MANEIRDCLPPDRNPRKPGITLPKGAIDTHVHVFEKRYPLSPARGYNPPEFDARRPQTPACDARRRARGVHPAVGLRHRQFRDPGWHECAQHGDAEPRALRGGDPAWTSATTSLPPSTRPARAACGSTSTIKAACRSRFDKIGELEARIKPLGWHIEWLFPGKDIST